MNLIEVNNTYIFFSELRARIGTVHSLSDDGTYVKLVNTVIVPYADYTTTEILRDKSRNQSDYDRSSFGESFINLEKILEIYPWKWKTK